jgi:hypothetical protein
MNITHRIRTQQKQTVTIKRRLKELRTATHAYNCQKYLLAFTGPRKGDAGGIGGVDVNKKVNASMGLLERSKGLLLCILDNPFGLSRSVSFDSDLSSKKAFASRWSCSIVNRRSLELKHVNRLTTLRRAIKYHL